MVDVTVMRETVVCVACVCVLRECESARVTKMLVYGDGGEVVVVSAGHMGCLPGPGIGSSTDDVLGISMVRGMRGGDGVCEMCMCLARGGVGGEGVSG